MKTLKAFLPREPLALLALAIVSTFLFCFVYNRLSLDHWRVPLEYGTDPETSDAKAVLSHVKAAYDGDFVPLLWKNPRLLNAPGTANWNDMPIVEEFLFWGTGMLARVIGIFPAVNCALLLQYILAAAVFYWVAREIGVKATFAFAGALIFSFARYPFARQIHHLQVAYYWYVPLCVLVSWWVARRELRFGERKFWISCGIGAVTGLQNPYYTAMFAQLVALSALVALIRKDRLVAQAAGIVLAITFAFFLSMNIDTFTYRASHGANAGAMVRNYGWLEFYALKPLDLIMPPGDRWAGQQGPSLPGHRFPLLAELGNRYFPVVMVPGETPPGGYIGIIGIASLLMLAAVSARNAMASPLQPVPVEAWQVLWIGFYSMIGGFNGFLGVFGMQLFRSANRYSIFILAIVLLFAIGRMSKWKMDNASRMIIAILLSILALWDQTPSAPKDEMIGKTARTIESDRNFVGTLEKRLPKGAMIYQFPPMQFPETPIAGLSSYEHFRPYFFTGNLRFSFGTIKGRGDDLWQQQIVSNASVQSIIESLERYGFSGFYVNTTPLKDKGASIKKQFAEAGRSDIVESADGELFCILLKPSDHPSKPAGLSGS